MDISEVTKKDFDEWLELGLALWPHYRKKKDKLEQEFNRILKSPKETAFLVKDKGKSVAFANLSLRTDFVQGASTSPVAYLEGIYVDPNYRKRGLAKRLVEVAKKWAKENGCKELASDAELDNIASQNFHKRIGFREVKRTVNFIQSVKE